MELQLSSATRPTLILAEEETVRLRNSLQPQSTPSLTPAEGQALAAEAAQWLQQGTAQFRQGQFTPALALLKQALQAYQDLADQPQQAKVLMILASVYYRLADYVWAADYGRQCLQLAYTLPDLSLLQQVLGHLGNSYRHLGDLQQALQYMNQSLQVAKDMGDRRAEMRALNNLAMVYRAKGLTRQAATLYEASLLIAQGLEDTVVQLQILQNLGNTYQSLRHYSQAIECYEAFLKLNQGEPNAVVDNCTTRRILTRLTTASLAIQDYDRAILHLQQHLTMACTLGDTRSATALMDELRHCYNALNQVRAFRPLESVSA